MGHHKQRLITTALCLSVEGQRKKGRTKRTWKKQVVEESVKVGLSMEDTLHLSTWSVGIKQIATRLSLPSLVGEPIRF